MKADLCSTEGYGPSFLYWTAVRTAFGVRTQVDGRLAAMTPLDTTPAANAIQLSILRKMSGTERLRIAIELSEFARQLAFARIEHAQPGLTKSQMIREFLRCVMSEDDYPRLLGSASKRNGVRL